MTLKSNDRTGFLYDDSALHGAVAEGELQTARVDSKGALIVRREGTTQGTYLDSDGPGLDDYLSLHFTKDGDGSTKDASVDASGGVQYWEWRPPEGEVWRLARILVFVQDTGAFSVSAYGFNVAVTNGITLQKVRGVAGAAVELFEITDGAVTINPDWARYCYDTRIDSYGAGANETLAGRWTMTKGGVYIRLDGDLDEAVRVNINDNFSTLDGHYFIGQGYIEGQQS